MSEIEEMRAAVRRKINPLDNEQVRAAETLITDLAVRSGDVDVLRGNALNIALISPLHELAEQRFLMSDGRSLSYQEYRSLSKDEALSLSSILMRPRPEPYVNPALPEPNEEDARRLADLVAIRGGASLDEVMTVAPTWDENEARAWVKSAVNAGTVTLDGDRLVANEDPVAVDLNVENLGGNCPVQAEGRMNGIEFYYRARGENQSVETDDGFFMQERVIGGPYMAGWLGDEQAREFITRAAMAHNRHLKELRIKEQDNETLHS